MKPVLSRLSHEIAERHIPVEMVFRDQRMSLDHHVRNHVPEISIRRIHLLGRTTVSAPYSHVSTSNNRTDLLQQRLNAVRYPRTHPGHKGGVFHLIAPGTKGLSAETGSF
jgi:hypothetical protein